VSSKGLIGEGHGCEFVRQNPLAPAMLVNLRVRLTSRQAFFENLWCPEAIFVTETRNPKDLGHSDLAASQGSRLAHWPPPFRSVGAKPIIIQHPRGEVPKRAKPRGWRMTRAMFSEFEEE
jgi:hypothetical protein